MTVFLLVPGSHHGGWWYDDVVEGLRTAAHRAVALTLPGLDPEGSTPQGVITLDDHVEVAFTALRAATAREEPRSAVLVGHSYGGSIITAMADAEPDRVRALVYLDALLPDDGDSSWSMTGPSEHEWYIDGSRASGAYVDTLPFFDDRARPHPLATLMQGSRLTGAWRRVATKHYVIATQWPSGVSPMSAMADRARADPDMHVHEWPTTHNVLREGPGRLLDLIIDL